MIPVATTVAAMPTAVLTGVVPRLVACMVGVSRYLTGLLAVRG